MCIRVSRAVGYYGLRGVSISAYALSIYAAKLLAHTLFTTTSNHRGVHPGALVVYVIIGAGVGQIARIAADHLNRPLIVRIRY